MMYLCKNIPEESFIFIYIFLSFFFSPFSPFSETLYSLTQLHMLSLPFSHKYVTSWQLSKPSSGTRWLRREWDAWLLSSTSLPQQQKKTLFPFERTVGLTMSACLIYDSKSHSKLYICHSLIYSAFLSLIYKICSDSNILVSRRVESSSQKSLNPKPLTRKPLNKNA